MDPESVFKDPLVQQMYGFDTKLSRAELFGVLSSFGISIPPTSKLPDDSLQKRLRQAINASQAMLLINSKPPLDLNQYPKWPRNCEGLLASIARWNLEENSMIRAMRESQDPSSLFDHPSMDVRRISMHLANNAENVLKHAVLQDPNKERCSINLRVDVFVHASLYLTQVPPRTDCGHL